MEKSRTVQGPLFSSTVMCVCVVMCSCVCFLSLSPSLSSQWVLEFHRCWGIITVSLLRFNWHSGQFRATAMSSLSKQNLFTIGILNIWKQAPVLMPQNHTLPLWLSVFQELTSFAVIWVATNETVRTDGAQAFQIQVPVPFGVCLSTIVFFNAGSGHL